MPSRDSPGRGLRGEEERFRRRAPADRGEWALVSLSSRLVEVRGSRDLIALAEGEELKREAALETERLREMDGPLWLDALLDFSDLGLRGMGCEEGRLL